MAGLCEKKYFFFDLDDTLINTSIATEFGIKKAYFQLLKAQPDLSEKIGFEEFKAELDGIYKKQGGVDYTHDVFEQFAKGIVPRKQIALPFSEDSLAAKLFLDYRETMNHALMPLPGAIELLSYLEKCQKARMGITRGKSTHQHLKLILTGLETSFKDITVVGKPGETKEKALNEIIGTPEFNKEFCVMVGDSPEDIEAGQLAGIDTVRVKHGRHAAENFEIIPTFSFDGLEELLDAVKGQGKEGGF